MNERLAVVLDIMLPGGEGFPPARAVGLADWIEAQPDFAQPLQAVLAACPPRLAQADAAAGTALLQAVERACPAAFERLLVAAYGGYYTHPEVLAAVARATGYAARPPQPLGHELAPFDTGLLARVAALPASWRPAP